jgi:hypothetical protein
MRGPKERQRAEREPFGVVGGDILRSSRVSCLHCFDFPSFHRGIRRKYERAKHTALELNDRERVVVKERQELTESLKTQESRYDKMKLHAMQQLEM